MRLERRIQRLETQTRLERAELMAEARRFFALPLATQLAEMESIAPELRAEGFTDADLADMRAALIRYYRPLEGDR
jgi:hypothetical protein